MVFMEPYSFIQSVLYSKGLGREMEQINEGMSDYNKFKEGNVNTIFNKTDKEDVLKTGAAAINF